MNLSWFVIPIFYWNHLVLKAFTQYNFKYCSDKAWPEPFHQYSVVASPSKTYTWQLHYFHGSCKPYPSSLEIYFHFCHFQKIPSWCRRCVFQGRIGHLPLSHSPWFWWGRCGCIGCEGHACIRGWLRGDRGELVECFAWSWFAFMLWIKTCFFIRAVGTKC